nr:hypothetical protein [Tanacetum cinerariifolium]
MFQPCTYNNSERQLASGNSKKSFVTPVNIEIIESFMHAFSYLGFVDKWDFNNRVLQKKDVIQYPRFTKLIIADLMKKYPSISPKLEEEYHSIKDDIPLVSVYTTGNVTVQGMLILDAFLTKAIRTTDDYKEYEMVFVVEGERDEESYTDKFPASMLHDDVDYFRDRIEPESHKEHPKVVDDDDEIKEEKKDDEMGSLENKTQNMQTPIITTPRSHRINLSPDKNISQELTDTVSLSTTTTSKDPDKKRCISIHGKVDQVLHEGVPQLAKKATIDLIEENLKRVVADTVIQERDAFQAEVPAHISNEFAAQAPRNQSSGDPVKTLAHRDFTHLLLDVHPTITTLIDTTSSADLQLQLYLKMKSNLQDQANDLALWEVLKRKFGKSSTSNTSFLDDDDAWEDETIINEDEVIPEDETPELITKFQNVFKRVPTIFGHARMEVTLNDMLINRFRNPEEYAYHLEQATNFMENQIV